MAQKKEHITAPEKVQLSNEEIANLSDEQFKALIIRVLTEMDEYDCKIEEEVKAMKSKMKRNIQGTNSEGKKTRTQINSLEYKEEINVQPEQNEETRIQKKMRRGLGTSRTTLNLLTFESHGCQKEKRKSNKLKTYLKT